MKKVADDEIPKLLSLLPPAEEETPGPLKRTKGVELLYNWLLPYALGVGQQGGEIDPAALTFGRTFRF